MSDPGTSYRTRDEIQEIRSTRDPISIFKEKILNSNLATADELKKIEQEIKTVIDVATKQAREDGEIPLEELSTDVYSKPLEPAARGILPWHEWELKTLNKPLNKD